MSAPVMTQAASLPVNHPDDLLPKHVRIAVDKHLAKHGGIPTEEAILEISNDQEVRSYWKNVLKYFIIEADLNYADLRPLINKINDPQVVSAACRGAHLQRASLNNADFRFRWVRTT